MKATPVPGVRQYAHGLPAHPHAGPSPGPRPRPVRAAKRWACLAGLLWLPLLAGAQELPVTPRQRLPRGHERGVMVGYGAGQVNEFRYDVVFLMAHLAVEMGRRENRPEGSSRFTVYLEPQANLVMTKNNDFEFGINVGVQYMFRLSPKVHPYLLAGAGPHFITVKTERQANGYIFSDNVGAGVCIFTSPGTALSVEVRGRHLSNAGLEKPNSGINSHIVQVGYRVFLRDLRP
ncbi:MAG: hypothetical protein AVDCRST_MAG56-3539 [uncultured Cytophagales bacterium]|uniref:Outer membrane protein beta-barrel domain-containing protein n=1 Tax=uncultured Cytophagales bacterium TaxID=158755 RepID=A0A6J4JG95_9SPHI|nr:MAG: hypothetical protein AVDCRST_MAG56-3539 [uncultured Cytophagales bacterium]